MKFYFELNDEDFDLYCSSDFKQVVINNVTDQIVDKIVEEINFNISVSSILKDCKQEIIDKVIEKVSIKVSESIAKKKAIMEITPKVSELTKIDRENEKYFIDLIDKAIAKRFKNV